VTPAPALRDDQLRFVEAELPPARVAGRRVLEIGCGRGLVARLLTSRAERPALLAAIDPNAADEDTGGVAFRRAEAAALPFADASFDLAYSIVTFEHVHDLAAALAEIARVLRPGARFVTVVNPVWTGFRGHHWGPDLCGKPHRRAIELPWAHRLLETDALEDYLAEAEGFSGEEAAAARAFIQNSDEINRLGLPAYEAAFAGSPLRLARMGRGIAVMDGADGLRGRFARCAARAPRLLAAGALERFLAAHADESPEVYKFTAEMERSP